MLRRIVMVKKFMDYENMYKKHMSKDKTFIIIIALSLLVIIVGLQGTAMHRVFAATSDLNNISGLSNTQGNNNILLTKILAKNLENHLQKAGAILEITSKL